MRPISGRYSPARNFASLLPPDALPQRVLPATQKRQARRSPEHQLGEVVTDQPVANHGLRAQQDETPLHDKTQ